MESNEFKISVIIPFYNEELYLEDAIVSILQQTLKDIEIILIDDGSTDNSSQIAKKYAKEYTNVVYIRQNNSGQGIARNKGMKMARGRYIYFLDSDDYLVRDAMEKVYTVAKKNNSDIVTFNSRVDKYDTSEFIVDYSNREFLRENMMGIEYLYESLKHNKFYIPVWLYFYDIEFLKKSNIQFESVLYEDRIFTMQILFEKPKITYQNKILHCRRIRELSTMTQKKSIKHLEGAYTNIIRSYDAYLRINENVELKNLMLEFVRRNINIFIGVARLVENNNDKKILKAKGQNFLLSHPNLFSLKKIIKLRLA
ncbi:glycosyltransferase [uncultured Metabacillus sp.]|uniref:glycosyltransferase n=1 Tax=uncultured Metabacillus sp. TaxID=2860135 RepID=UPI002606343F|nr:glycosyltransferase [uncultured Metabacillus sp.]